MFYTHNFLPKKNLHDLLYYNIEHTIALEFTFNVVCSSSKSQKYFNSKIDWINKVFTIYIQQRAV